MRSWWYRLRLRMLVHRYRAIRSRYDCGGALASYINPECGMLEQRIADLGKKLARERGHAKD